MTQTIQNGHDHAVLSATAAQVAKLCSQITSYLAANQYKQPDFTPESADVPTTREYEHLRNQLKDSTDDLLRLVNGPQHTLREIGFVHCDLAAWQAALTQEFFWHVPDDKVGLTAEEIAKKAGMDVDRTVTILKMIATHRAFEEVDGRFRHTAISAFIKKSLFGIMCQYMIDEPFRASSEMNAWIEHSPSSVGESFSPFYHRYGMSIFEFFEKNPKKAKQFSTGMTAWSLIDDNFSILRDQFDWAGLTNTKVVDIGGGNGHVSHDLAREYPSLTFTVQDISPLQLSSAQAEDALRGRIAYEQYDYLTPQPVRDAGVYFHRATLHNNNDKRATKMLKALVPAMENRKQGDEATLLIMDVILPEKAGGDITRAEENQHRQLDLLMLIMVGACERTIPHWERLLKAADERFQISKTFYSPKGAGLLEIKFRTEHTRGHSTAV